MQKEGARANVREDVYDYTNVVIVKKKLFFGNKIIFIKIPLSLSSSVVKNTHTPKTDQREREREREKESTFSPPLSVSLSFSQNFSSLLFFFSFFFFGFLIP